MKKFIKRTLMGLGLAAIGAVLMAGSTTRSKPVVFAESSGCILRSLSSTYGFSFAGYVGSSNPYTPIAAAGTISFRPDATLTRNFNGSFGGSLFPVNDSGTYSLTGDCTFTANLPAAGETWNLIPVDDGKQIEFFVNTSGRVGAGTLIRQ